LAGIEMTLVMTAEPATAQAPSLVRVPDFLTARAIASPTSWASVIFFSITELGGSGSTA
jgi:hypothetical protein